MVVFDAYTIQEMQRTVTYIMYSTQQTAFPTGTVTYGTQPAGFGSIFYLGAGLIVVAGVALAAGGMSAKRTPAHAQPTIPVAPPALGYCSECGCRCDLRRLPRYKLEQEEETNLRK
jgi:hypothetical protein